MKRSDAGESNHLTIMRSHSHIGLANLPTVERKGEGFIIIMNRRLAANAVPMLNRRSPFLPFRGVCPAPPREE